MAMLVSAVVWLNWKEISPNRMARKKAKMVMRFSTNVGVWREILKFQLQGQACQGKFLVRQVKLRVQAPISILIFTELLILSLTPLHSQYCERKKHNLDWVPFAPISQKQNGGAAQRVRSLVYNEGFHLRKYPSKFSVFQWAEQWN